MAESKRKILPIVVIGPTGPVIAKEVKQSFGLGQIGNVTPLWAKWMFRGTMVLTTVVGFYIAATTLVPEAAKTEILLGLKAVDMFMLGVSKLFGYEPKPETEK